MQDPAAKTKQGSGQKMLIDSARLQGFMVFLLARCVQVLLPVGLPTQSESLMHIATQHSCMPAALPS